MKKFLTLRTSVPIFAGSLVLILGLRASNVRAADIVNEPLTNGNLPTGWTATGVTFETTGGGYARFHNTTSVLSSPVLDLTAYTGVVLDFDVAKYGSGTNGPITVEFSDDGGATWSAQTFNSPTPTSSTYLHSGPTSIMVTGSNVRFRFTSASSPSEKRLRNIVLSGTPPPTSVAFSAAASSIGEADGHANLTLNIFNPSMTMATSVDVVLTSGDAARIGNYTTQTITWPAGDGTAKTVSVTITDNAACDGNAVLALELQNITGGNIAGASSPFSHVLTVEDDETAMGTTVATAATAVGETTFTANWNAVTGAAGYYLDVSTSPTFGTPAARVVGWDFNDQNKIADSGVPANATRVISTTADGWEGYGAGVTGFALRKKGWHSGINQKAWIIKFSTIGLATLTVSSVQRSWNSGPRDFKLQYRIGNSGAWTDVAGGNITVANNFTTGVLSNVALPTICDNQPLVQVRWVMRSNVNVEGNGSVGIGGNSVIDDIVVDAAETPDYLPGYQNFDVGNVTSYNIPGLDEATTYYYRVRTYNACGTSMNSNTISVTTLPSTTYYSRGSGTVLDPIWSLNRTGTIGYATFGAGFSMVVQNGHAVDNTSGVNVKNLTIETGGALSLDAASSLTVHGDEAIFDGSLTAADNSTLALAGADATILESNGGPLSLWNLTVNTPQGTLTDATISIRGTLQLDGGDFDATMANITLASTASGTGRLGAVAATADYLGNLTVQRYIPAGHTNWRMLGSAVAGQTIQNWKDDFLTAGFPGSHYPPFDDPVGSGILWPSIRWYDETVVSSDPDDGVVGVSSNTQPLAVGQGFLAWSGDNLTSTTAFTVDVTGAPTIAQSPVTLPMSFTSSGDVNADGWNLVGNPLPSPIDFEAISRGNDVRNAYWIFDPVAGNNKAWTGGIGQGSLNGKIQSSQAFWVKADGTDLTTTVDEDAKVNLPTGGTFGGSQNAVLPVLSLHMASGLNTYSDEATIVFANGSPAYGGDDALKMTFKTVGAPQIGVRSSGGELLSVDFFGTYNEAIQIPLDVDVDVTGTYTITAAFAGFNSLSCLTLVDQLTGTVTPLTDGASYTFSITAGDEGNTSRFVINGTKPVALYVDHAPCFGQDGSGGVISNGGPIDLVWTDAFGNTLLHQGAENSSGDYFQFNAPAGNYMVYMSPAGACGQVSASFTITEPPAIESSVTTTATTCPNGDDGTAAVSATGGTAPYGFLWSNGATTAEITGPAGAYTVTVTDANGCMLPLEVAVPAGEGAIAGFALNGEAVAGVPMVFSNTSVLADQYFWDFGDGQTSTEEAPAHTWALPGEYTVALTASDEVCSDTFTMTVIVGIGTGIGGNDGGDLHVWATPDHIVIAHPFGSAPVDVDVHDATGRLVLSRTAISKPDRIALDDRKLSTGVWFVRVTSGKTQRTFRVPLVR